VVVAFDYVEVTLFVEANLVRHVERCGSSRTTVTRITTSSITGDCFCCSCFEVQTSDALIVEIAEVELTIRADDDAVGIIDLFFREARSAGADHGGDTLALCK